MRDLFHDYKKQNSKKNTVIIVASLAFAFSINMFLFGTDIGARLQTSVVNSTMTTNSNPVVDLKVVSAGTGTDMVKIQTNKQMESVAKIELPLAFDPDWLTINDIFSEDKDVEVIKNSNIAGNSIVYINFNKPKNIAENTSIVTIVYKKTAPKTTVLNIGEASFISIDGTRYFLDSHSLEF